jgi:lipoprotein-anchoring transpeptidase ErfK/SrfK
MNTKRLLLSLGLLFALVLAVFGDKAPNTSISHPTLLTAVQVPHANQASATKQATQQSTVLVVKDRHQLIARHDKQPAGLFDPHSWAPPPRLVPQVILQPPPPTAPPLPFTYLGKQKESEEWVVFLKRDNVTYIVKPLDVIEAAYRVEAIAPPSMTLIYLPLNQPQTLLIE